MGFATIDPATGAEVMRVLGHSEAEVEDRLQLASDTFARYRKQNASTKSALLSSAADLLEGELPDVAHMITTEMGKTFAQAKGEVAKCALGLRWYGQNGERLLEDEVITKGESQIHWEPLGPVLAVMPWNFPLWQVVRFAAPALCLGNVGLLKHASNVPQCALYLEDLFLRAGFEKGCFSTLLIEADKVKDVIADDRVAAVTLTGSEPAGRSVAAAAGSVLKKCVLELGGSDPFLVLESADLDRAVSVGVQARVQNNGQSCIAAKRFIIHASIAREFTERFADAMAALQVGNPFTPASEVGPLATARQRDEVAEQVDDAVGKGARVLCGGKALDRDGYYYPPTVLVDANPSMRVFEEEVFGPVAVIYQVADLTQAIALANATSFGLGSSVWTTDPGEQKACVEGIEAGQVFFNSMVSSMPTLPFGGIKRSGYGRELGDLGLKEFASAKSVFFQ